MQDTTGENKLRLLMILAAIYPEKFEGEKGHNLMKVGTTQGQSVYSLRQVFICDKFLCFQLAKLPPDDMNAVNNMRLLGGSSDTKKSSIATFSLKFDMHKVNVYIIIFL